MKIIIVTMRDGDKTKKVYVNAEKIECIIPLEEGCRILFPYLSQDGDICHMSVTESAATVVERICEHK